MEDSERSQSTALHERLDVLSGEVGRYGPRSVPTELRREHLLTCASIAFVEDGFETASMQRIAAMAGVTKPVLYDMFGSKEDLFVAVMNHANEELSNRLEAATARRGESQLAAGVRAYLLYMQERTAAWGRLLSSGATVVADSVARMRARQAEVVTAGILRGYEDAGLVADERRAEALAHYLIGAVEGVSWWWADNQDLSVDDLVDFIEEAAAPSLAAIRREGAPSWAPHTSPAEAAR